MDRLKTRRDVFFGYHPAVNFLYFIMITGFSMFFLHPVLLATSFFGGFFYDLYLKGHKALKDALWMTLPVFVLSALVNPLFSHQGATILAYFPSGNPLTLESVIYGLVSGLMLSCVLTWFYCFEEVMTSEKLIYLFGKTVPVLSLILSMVFRFIPEFKAQILKISNSQKCIGRDVTNGNVWSRLRHGLRILSIMATWALENSIETADSMRSRGYGLRGRTTFSLYSFKKKDGAMCAVLLGMSFIVLSGILKGSVRFLFYPWIATNSFTFSAAVLYACHGIFCFLPLMADLIGDAKWSYLTSKI